MYETKDLNRLMDIKSKSSVHGMVDTSKALGLANHMASLIKDAEKCKRRYEASCFVFGNSHSVTQTFYSRYISLSGGTAPRITQTTAPAPVVTPATVAPKPVSKAEWGSTKPQPEEREEDTLYLKKGRAKGTLEIWKTWSKGIIHVCRTSGTPNAIGASCNFYDEDRKFLFGAELVDWCGSEHSQEAESKYGKSESTWQI
jgi:hypothetical protein